MRSHALLLLALIALPLTLGAQGGRSVPAAVASAPIADVAYEVTFTRATAARRLLHVVMTFSVTEKGPVILSLPAWTPGAYELSNFARWVHGFGATSDGKPLTWDKVDYDTWRVQPAGAKRVEVAFDYRADSLDNAMAWSREDFASFNGTNVFLYPEGRDAAFRSTVTVKTESDWLVATGMTASGAHTYTATNYHDLVDMPTFIGHFDLDSAQVGEKWVRVASYPAGMLADDARKALWQQLQQMFPPMIAVTGEVPYPHYTVLMVFDSSSTGGSALEHQNSHFGIYTPFIIGNAALPSITAHEIFHLWNVKRMRPAEMVPYKYDRAQPTPWLWVSEGITDYYADLALVRGGVIDSTQFVALVEGKMGEVAAAPPTALEDASLSTWIHPDDGSGYLYYPKGSLAGFMLDVMIRDASDNQHSLDDVMRDVYRTTFKAGKGFTSTDWWGAVEKAARGGDTNASGDRRPTSAIANGNATEDRRRTSAFAEANTLYIDGREPFPWSRLLPLAGLRLTADTIHEPRLGVFTAPDSSGGVVISELEPGGAAAEAGVKPGDHLLSVGDVPVTDASFGPRFRARYASAEGQSIPLVVRRAGQTVTLQLKVRTTTRLEEHVGFAPAATPRAQRVRHGILTGTTGP